MQLVKNILIVQLLIVSLVSCRGDCYMKGKEIEKYLNSALSVGDPLDKASKIIGELDIKFSFDKYQNRYQGAVYENCRKNEAIKILIIFDQDNKLSSIKVSKEITWL